MIYPGCLYTENYYIAFGLYKKDGRWALVEIMYNYDGNSIRIDWTPYRKIVEVVAT